MKILKGLLPVLMLMCFGHLSAEKTYYVWTSQFNQGELANKMELTPDKPYAEFWVNDNVTSAILKLTLYVEYSNESDPTLNEKSKLIDFTGPTSYAVNFTSNLACGVRANLQAHNDVSSNNCDRVRVFFSHVPTEGKLKLTCYYVNTNNLVASFDIVDASEITVVDPLLDTQAGPESIGQLICPIISTAEITSYRWVGSEKKIANTNANKSILQLHLPQSECNKTRTVELYTTITGDSNWDISSWTFMTTAKIESKPFHSIVKDVLDMTQYSIFDKPDGTDQLFTSEQEYRKGIRKYVSLVNNFNDCLCYDSEEGYAVKSNSLGESSIFTLVGTRDNFKIIPYGYNQSLSYSGKYNGNAYSLLKFEYSYDSWHLDKNLNMIEIVNPESDNPTDLYLDFHTHYLFAQVRKEDYYGTRFKFYYYGTYYSNAYETKKTSLRDDAIYVSESDFNKGVRKYVELYDKSNYIKLSYNSSNNEVVGSKSSDKSTLFTLVGNKNNFKIIPFGFEKPLGIKNDSKLHMSITENWVDWKIQSIDNDDVVTNNGYVTSYGYASYADFLYLEKDGNFRLDTGNEACSRFLVSEYGDDPYVDLNIQDMNPDKDKIRHPKNVFKWNILYPDDEDVMENDQFVVQRAYHPDFSDAQNIDVVSFDEFKKINRPGTDIDFGQYMVTDDDEKALYNRYERGNYSQKGIYPRIYYRAIRSVVNGIWPDSTGIFKYESAIELKSVIPNLSSITAQRSADWDSDHKAVLTVRLNNPVQGNVRKYVWDPNADITITRRGYEKVYENDPDTLTDKIITVKGTEVRWDSENECYSVSVDDILNYPFTYYYYTATVDTTNALLPSEKLVSVKTSESEAEDLYINSASFIQAFTATRGTESGCVVLNWEAADGLLDGFDITRKRLADDKFYDNTVIAENITARSFVDYNVEPGEAYQYTIRAKAHFRNKEYWNEVSEYGFCSIYGSIAGNIRMSNGTAMPGSYDVKISRKDDLIIREIHEYNNSNKILMSALSISKGKYVVVKCDENGYFKADSLVIAGASTDFEVQVMGEKFSFTNNSGTSGPFVAHLTGKATNIDDLVFTNADQHRFSGRVLYENSTVPVRDVSFRVFYGNDTVGYTLKDSDGNDIVTNETGNFDFYVPKVEIRVQAYKTGHVMKGDGFIKNDKDQIQFVPNKALAGLQLADQTKVRLVGRLVGGDNEGDKPLGFGLSKNNLGDNLTIVLQLEGDNTAQIVYHNDDPDRTTDEYQFARKVYSQDKILPSTDTTNVSFEKKRIVIHPEVTTGEFTVDLFPVKYKVTQLSAKGYSTLYREGEGFQVLDLSSDSIAIGETAVNGDMSVHYNATYQKVYHAPVTITYKQSYFGLEQNVLGEQKVKQKNLENEKVTITLAEKVKKSDEVIYTMGVPVFMQGNEYTLKAFAHEDYYYNGIQSNNPDIVNIRGGKLIISNGLVSSSEENIVEIDKDGTASFSFVPDNPDFLHKGDQALRSIRIQVDVNGRYYDAEPLKAYVLGSRKKGDDVLIDIPDKLQLFDVVRDPMGSGSYSYREKGTTYTWNHTLSSVMNNFMSIETEVGGGMAWSIGLGYQTEMEVKATVAGSFNIPLAKKLTKEEAEYTMTLNERISTSDDVYDQGTKSDVYIGAGISNVFSTQEAVSMVDKVSFDYLKEAIAQGAVCLIDSGQTTDGSRFYLVRGDKIIMGQSVTSTFAYSQKHIMGVVIPELEKQRNSLLRVGMDKETAQRIADETGEFVYISSDNTSDCVFDPVTGLGHYQAVAPANGKSTANRVASINSQIAGWRTMIETEEKQKIDQFQKKPSAVYDIAGSEVSGYESASYYYQKLDDIDLKKESNSWSFTGGGGKDNNRSDDSKQNKNKKVSYAMLSGFVASLRLGGGKEYTPSEDYTYFQMYSAGCGYVLKSNDNGYFTTQVFNVDNKCAPAPNDFVDNNLNANTDTNSPENNIELAKNHKLHSYIFRTIGGAVRTPWFGADTTLVYTDPQGKHVELNSQLKKIDNPKIYIDNPVMSNVPQNERAMFDICLTNETEISDASKYLTPTSLLLYLDDSSNPNGAKLYMDGMPITDGRHIYLEPGQSLRKTLEVSRGKGYDFDNLKLVFSDETFTLDDDVALSVHFLPEATPVVMTMPDDKWVMNTLSAKDDEGKYFIPVSINGFDVNSEDFDHIEFQYKKHTEGESQWVNICSYFASDSLYALASGEKAMIEGGSISNIRFYGEKDPIEMEYDLRAVSFRRWGTGYMTRASNVVSGFKDTRPPRVFGMPKPANGILTYDDVISLPFNEDFAYNYLDETANFQIQGYTNNSDIDQSTTLHLDEDGYGYTKVSRNLSRHDFSIDMMIKTKSAGGDAWLMAVDTVSARELRFGISESQLYIWLSGREYISKIYDYDFSQTLTRVGVIYSSKDSVVKFIFNETIDTVQLIRNYYDDVYCNYPDSLKGACNANGPVYVGGLSDMNMKEIRLWNKALTSTEVAMYKGKRLNGTEMGLLAYWPLDETLGHVAADKANGADLYLTNTSWNIPEGKSLKLNGDSVILSKQYKFERSETSDYTLSFWFKAESLLSDTTTLFRAGRAGLSETDKGKWHIFFDNGLLTARTNGISYNLGETDYRDNHGWHRLDISVSHSHNTAAFMLDGKLVAQKPADKIGGVNSGSIQLGSNHFHGNFDDVAFWHVALPLNYIKSMFNVTPSGKEMELQVFLPFSTVERNDQNTLMDVFCPCNMVIGKSGKCLMDTMMYVTKDNVDNTQAPLHNNSGLSNLPFTWTCSDNELLINIDKTDEEINHQQINITVRGVEDLRGNSLERPQMWTVYVDRNVLTWDDQTINLDLKYGEGKTITTRWRNKSGRNVEYYIDNNCDWLTIDLDRGSISPVHSQDLTIDITDGLAPGRYSSVLYLVDENNLSSPLNVNVTVTADEPAWKVADNLNLSGLMNVVAQVKMKENNISSYSTDGRDIIAAFCNDTCVGRAYITLKNNTSYVFLNIVGNPVSMNDKKLEFYFWDASTNHISLLDVVEGGNDANGIKFKNGAVVGSIEKPVMFVTTDKRIQTIYMKAGWNWISMNVTPETDNIAELFVSDDIFTAGDQFSAMGNDYFVTHKKIGVKSGWSGNKDKLKMERTSVYQVHLRKDVTAQIIGHAISEKDRYVTLTQKGWNDLPYYLDVDQPINVAMSDYIAMEGGKAAPGTVIKSHYAFAIAGDDGRWYGTLEYMHPGEGYYVNHSGNVPCVIHYTNTKVNGQTAKTATRSVYSSMPSSGTSMPVVAAVSETADCMSDDMVLAVSEGQIVGQATMQSGQDGKQLFFITVNAQDGSSIRFAHVQGGKIVGMTSKSVPYSSKAVIGTMDEPYTMKFDAENDGWGIYDLKGIRHNEDIEGIYIKNGKKIYEK